MSEYTMQFKRWHALVAVVVVLGLVGIRLLTFSDKRNDAELMQALEVQLMSDYYPDLAERLQTAYDAGDEDTLEQVAASVTSTKAEIESVRISSPLLDFSSPKDVVVKVQYALQDDAGAREERTRYYLFRHGGLGNTWSYQYETGAVSYYLNFL
jgi:hypothetical protein